MSNPCRGQTGGARARGAFLVLTSLVTALGATQVYAEEYECGLVAPVPSEMQAMTPAELALAVEGAPAQGAFDIVLVAGPGLQANPAALAAFERAAAQWEAVIRDPITVTIDADLTTPPVGALAATTPVTVGMTLASAVAMLARDAADEPADTGAQRLMELVTLPARFPDTFSFSGVVGFTKAAAKALSDGSVDLDATRGVIDGRIVFGPMIPFDFDNRDGVPLTAFDFETAAVHEIGHLLGFISIVDGVETVATDPQKPPVVPFPVFALDLFRFPTSVDSRPDAFDFTQRPRELLFGVEAMFDDIDHEFRMSTGRRGDGRQASHWKANELTRFRIGVLDPTLSPGELIPISAPDLRALDLIGYEVASGDALPAVSILANGAEAGPTAAIPANQPVQFQAQVSDADGLGFPAFSLFGNPALVSFLWDFGGRPAENGSLAALGPSPQVQFALSVGGPSQTFPVSLTAIDALGDSTTRTVNVLVSETPTVSFTANGEQVLERPNSPPSPPFRPGKPVQLQAIAADRDGLGFPIFGFAGVDTPITYLWDFGGAKPSDPLALFSERPLVTFDLAPGEEQRTFSVSLTVFDALGLSTTRTASIVSQRSGPPFVNVTVDGHVVPTMQTALEVGDQLARQDGVLQLGNVSFDEDGLGFPIFASFGNSTPVSFVWGFGGGVPDNPLDVFSPSPRVRFPIGTQEGQTVTIALTVIDAKGQSTTRVLSLLTRPTPR